MAKWKPSTEEQKDIDALAKFMPAVENLITTPDKLEYYRKYLPTARKQAPASKKGNKGGK